MTARSSHPLWDRWRSMHRRCENPRHDSFRFYGARGVRVCERWRVFENFLADMGTPPVGASIDRINNNGDYEPGNCRWATWAEQGRNKNPARGVRNGSAKLNQASVDRLRAAFSTGLYEQKALAHQWGISESQASRILRGKGWNA